MFTSHRFPKSVAIAVGAALTAGFVVAGVAERSAHSQISGSTGGDLAPGQLIEEEGIFFEVPPRDSVLVTTDEIANDWTDGTSNTVMLNVKYTLFLPDGTPELAVHDVTLDGRRRVRIAADVTMTDLAGGTRTERIIAVLIGLFAPQARGFVDYTDDGCGLADGGAPANAERQVCAAISRAFRAVMQKRRLAVSPRAVMAQTPDGIAIWEPR
jgi:hypothetical protein